MPLKKIEKNKRTRHDIALVHSSLAPSPTSLYGTKEIGTKIILHQPPPSTIHFAIGTKYVYVDQVYVKSRTKSEQQYVKMTFIRTVSNKSIMTGLKKHFTLFGNRNTNLSMRHETKKV